MPSPNIRQEFNAFMQNRVSSAHANGTPTRRTKPVNGSLDPPTHPAFDRLEEMKMKQLEETKMRQLQEVSTPPSFEQRTGCWTDSPVRITRH